MHVKSNSIRSGWWDSSLNYHLVFTIWLLNRLWCLRVSLRWKAGGLAIIYNKSHQFCGIRPRPSLKPQPTGHQYLAYKLPPWRHMGAGMGSSSYMPLHAIYCRSASAAFLVLKRPALVFLLLWAQFLVFILVFAPTIVIVQQFNVPCRRSDSFLAEQDLV